MTVNNVKQTGRRIYCARRKEGGRCDHGKTYALAPIEARVVVALRAQLSDPRAIKRFVETYTAERRRLAAQQGDKRRSATRELEQTGREVERLVAAIAKGSLQADEAGPLLAPLRQRKALAEAELASLPPAEVIELHPATIRRYLDAVTDLAETLQRRTVEGSEAVAAALQELIVSITVTPGPAGPQLAVAGRLERLGAQLPPDLPFKLVAGTRYRHKKHNTEATFSFAA